MMQTRSNSALLFLENRTLTPFSALALRIVATLVIWQERRKSRRALGTLDDHMLRDIGLTRYEAQTESERPFWEGPHWWRQG